MAWGSRALFGPVIGSVEECICQVINRVISCHLIRSRKFLENFTMEIAARIHFFFTQPASHKALNFNVKKLSLQIIANI